MAKLIWTEESLAWLQDIDQFLAKTSDQAAISVLEGIIDKTEILCDHPRLGAQLIDVAEREVREVLYGRYRIIYEYLEAADAIYVLAVIHSAMDLDRLRL
ncbi:MAG: type II toxin-antitoxin system RelE/ParE family toxin [Pirellulales bacterium]|nr:type II toxin-antitoxin system RelE/ParE family toxin [Pirellulales bacterium]